MAAIIIARASWISIVLLETCGLAARQSRRQESYRWTKLVLEGQSIWQSRLPSLVSSWDGPWILPIFVSPSVGDMLGQKPTDLEDRDFFDLVFGTCST